MEDKIKVINSEVEKITMTEQFDVLVSEWMGFYLLHESMLDSVIYARDKFLKPGGHVMPNKALIWGALISTDEYDPVEWENYYGLDLSIIGGAEIERLCRAPKVDECIDQAQLLTEPVVVSTFDLTAVSVQEVQKFDVQLSFTVAKPGKLAALSLWFDTEFVLPGSTEAVVLSTSPMSPPTHWKQTVIQLGCFAQVQPGEIVKLKVGFEQDVANRRLYNISVETQ